MKICVVSDHFSSDAGGQHRTQNLSLGISKLGHEVTYVSPYGVSKNLSDLYISNKILNEKSSVEKYISPYFKDFFSVYRKINNNRSEFDFVIIGLPNTMSKALNSVVLRIKGIPVGHNFGGIWTSFFDRQSDFVKSNFRFLRPIAQAYEDSLTFLTAPFPKLITASTTPLVDLLKKFTRREVYLSLHPVDSNKFDPNKIQKNEALELIPTKYRSKRLVILGVKADEWFVPLLEKMISKPEFQNVVFLVIGDFPKAANICKRKQLEGHVFFTGSKSYDLLPKYISLASFAVVPTQPSLKNLHYAPHNIAKIADFLTMGKPVITDTRSAIDYVLPGKTGFLCHDDQEVIEKATMLLIDEDKSFKMSKNARKMACEMFDHVKVAEQYIQLVKEHVL